MSERCGCSPHQSCALALFLNSFVLMACLVPMTISDDGSGEIWLHVLSLSSVLWPSSISSCETWRIVRLECYTSALVADVQEVEMLPRLE